MVTRYAIIADGKVANVAVAESPLAENWIEAPVQVTPGWLYDGASFTPFPPPEPDPVELIETYRKAVQAHIDATAQSKGYETGFALAGYVNSTVPQWKAEAEVFVAWRDQVWLFVFGLLAEVQAGTAPLPESSDALIAQLPTITWP
jgi:hypothetical protein